MRTYARSTRALRVLGATAAAAALAALLLGPRAALIALLVVLMLGTFVTIPDDLEPGEYDLFGIGVLVAMVLIGIGAASFTHKPQVRYTSDMDVCGSSGCADTR